LLYAVVDIETTGGHAASNGITEIAIYITDGKNILDQYQTLLNPYYTIPRFVEVLTGITNEMVSGERDFKSVADELFDLLHDKIFVAHNVNFDYSFLKYYFAESGYELNCPKLCTIRLGRQVIPGLRGYGLEKICRHLDIEIQGRHRADGDAAATVQLFHHLLACDTNNYVKTMLKHGSKEQFLPPNVSASQMKNIPTLPGVYYFHDKRGKAIYIGKAKNLNKRVNSHFSNNKSNKQKQEFLKKIYSVSYQETATELMAFILESCEIRKLWPEQNRSQKRFEPVYALYSYEDGNGYQRLFIEKKKKHLKSLYSFNLLNEGYNLLRELINRFELCPLLCFIQKADPTVNSTCIATENNHCHGACKKLESPSEYNARVSACLHYLENELPTFALIENGFTNNEKSCILMEKGKFYGMGYLPATVNCKELDELKRRITPYKENDYIRGLIYKHVEQHPYKKVNLGDEFFKQSAKVFT
jgi:DNA polymerase-3 subunit epsilon